jgi:hypothetical protein
MTGSVRRRPWTVARNTPSRRKASCTRAEHLAKQAEQRRLTHRAKALITLPALLGVSTIALMTLQALLAVSTIALVFARAVNVLR